MQYMAWRCHHGCLSRPALMRMCRKLQAHNTPCTQPVRVLLCADEMNRMIKNSFAAAAAAEAPWEHHCHRQRDQQRPDNVHRGAGRQAPQVGPGTVRGADGHGGMCTGWCWVSPSRCCCCLSRCCCFLEAAQALLVLQRAKSFMGTNVAHGMHQTSSVWASEFA
jgi:hypothetical protein